MMKFTQLLKELNISKWSALWSFLTDGWCGVVTLVCKAFTKLLKKAPPDKLYKYAELTTKIAVFVRGGIDTFLTDGVTKDAAVKTADAIGVLANHLSDGVYTPEELSTDVTTIRMLVTGWDKALKEETALAA